MSKFVVICVTVLMSLMSYGQDKVILGEYKGNGIAFYQNSFNDTSMVINNCQVAMNVDYDGGQYLDYGFSYYCLLNHYVNAPGNDQALRFKIRSNNDNLATSLTNQLVLTDLLNTNDSLKLDKYHFKVVSLKLLPEQTFSSMADSLAKSDPMVKAGRLEIEIHPWWAAKGFQLR